MNQVAYRRADRDTVGFDQHIDVVNGCQSVIRGAPKGGDGVGEIGKGLLVQQILPHLADGVVKVFGCFINALDEPCGRTGHFEQVERFLPSGDSTMPETVPTCTPDIRTLALLRKPPTLPDLRMMV